jgi:FkbM family methyltransferase
MLSHFPHVLYSPYYEIVRRIRHPEYYKNLALQTQFFKNLLGCVNTNLIFDIGAHIGEKTQIFAQLAKKVISAEPDRNNIRVLRARFRNRKNVIIVDKALGYEKGSAPFYVRKDNPGHSAFNTVSEKWKQWLERENDRFKRMSFYSPYEVDIIRLDDLIESHGIPSLIKIDAEGLEEQIIMGLSYKVPLISFEANLPEFKDEALRCLTHLHALSETIVFNYDSGDAHSLVLDEFIPYESFARILHSSKLRYMEIYCRMLHLS